MNSRRNPRHEVPNSVPIKYFTLSKRGKPCEIPVRSTNFSLNPVLRVVLPPSSFLFPCPPSLISVLVPCPCLPSLFFVLPHVLSAPVLHSAIFCFISFAIFTLLSAFFLSRRQRQPQLLHIVLTHLIRIIPFSFHASRMTSASHAVPRIALLAFPWVYDTFSVVVESFRGRTDCLRCCLFCCFIWLSVGGGFFVKN